jgi:glycosyltransferase involved in cell wall biosynthesis
MTTHETSQLPSGKRSVCIVTPGHVASNPRVVKEADALHAAQYRVTVVAGNQTDFIQPFDEEIVRRVPWKIVRIDPARTLGRVRCRVARFLAAICPAGNVPSRLAVSAYSTQTAALTRAARKVTADLYIAHYVAALPAAAAAARAHGALLGYDAEDFHAGERTDPEALESVLVRAIEAHFLPRCRHATAAAPMIAEAYEQLYAIKPVPVLNVFPLDDEKPDLTRSYPRRAGELSAYWFSQTVGPDRGLQSFIEAMARTRARVTLHIRGSDRWKHGEKLLAFARALNLSGRVELLPTASPFEMVRSARQYDIGLSLETDVSESRRRCLTNKIFTYLMAARPVLMSDTPAQAALARELGEAAAVVSLADPDSIAQQLDAWALAPEKMKTAARTACRLAHDRYNWQVEQRVFLASVERALGNKGTGRCPS